MLDILCVLQKYGPLVFYLSPMQVQSLNSVFDSDTTCTYIYTVIDKHRQAQRIVSVYSLNPCVSFVLYLLLIMQLFTPRGLIPEIKSH